MNDIFEKIKNNDRKNIKYYNTFQSSKEIAKNIVAMANSGGGDLVFGVKDRGLNTDLELRGIGRDYNFKSILEGIKSYLSEDYVYEVEILQNKKKDMLLLNIKIKNIKKKIKFVGRVYVMSENMIPVKVDEKIFISHASVDKKYGEVLVKLLRGIGFKREQIIFTSNDNYGIPMGENIFDYLKGQINEGVYMIYLLSENYYQSVACLNEMGAAWIVQNEYTVIGVPSFDFSSAKFSEGAIDPRRIGIKINNKHRLVEFKNKLLERFDLSIDEVDWNVLLDESLESME